ncbi:hypothetical protein [Halioglobus sp. Uisw_031]
MSLNSGHCTIVAHLLTSFKLLRAYPWLWSGLQRLHIRQSSGDYRE